MLGRRDIGKRGEGKQAVERSQGDRRNEGTSQPGFHDSEGVDCIRI